MAPEAVNAAATAAEAQGSGGLPQFDFSLVAGPDGLGADHLRRAVLRAQRDVRAAAAARIHKRASAISGRWPRPARCGTRPRPRPRPPRPRSPQARARAQKLAADAKAKAKAEAAAREAEAEAQLAERLAEADARIRAARDQAMTHVRAIAEETAQAIVAKLTGQTPGAGEVGGALRRRDGLGARACPRFSIPPTPNSGCSSP